MAANTSILEYVDSMGTVHGTAAISWDTQANAFPMTASLPAGALNAPYSGTITSQASNLSSASVYRGHLPAGLSLSASGSTVTVSGTPAEAGVFDLWFQATTSDSKSSFIYSRLAIAYAVPPVILTNILPSVVIGQAYSVVFEGYGGVPPYTWSSDIATSFSGVAPYLSFTGNVFGGTVTDGTQELMSANVSFALTDANGTIATRTLLLSVNSSLVITTSVIPRVGLSVDYSFTLQAAGGVPPYTWSTAELLPTPAVGHTFALSSAGVLAGYTDDSGYGTQDVNWTVTDSTAASTTKLLPLSVGPLSGMTIDDSGVGPIYRGVNYNGTLVVGGTYTIPVSWTVTDDSPNPLPSGLQLQASVSNSGKSASIIGLYTGAPIPQVSNYRVKVQATDSAGHVTSDTIILYTLSSLAITTTSLPNGQVNVAYSQQLAATGGGSPTGGAPVYAWSASGVPAGFPFSLSSAGVLQGTGTSSGTWTFTANVADDLGVPDTASQDLTVTVSASNLEITTTSPLPGAVAGVAYSTPLAATGGVPPYTWGLVAGSLPSGLSLGSNGIISGTTSAVGSYTITVQVTDSVSSTAQKQLTLPVTSALTLQTGIDYTDGLSTGSLGYVASGSVDSISPRSNRSFYLVAQGLIATSASQITVGAPSGFSATVESVSSGTALIRLSGPYSSGSQGSNSQLWTITDNGNPSSPVQASITPSWTVYTNGALRTVPSSGSIPPYGVPLVEGTPGSLPIYNDPSNPVFNFQTYNGAAVDKTAAFTADFSFTGDNSAYSGVVSFGFDGTNYNVSYNGGSVASGVALTNLTITDDDIAWYNGTNNSFDTYGSGKSLVLPAVYLLQTTVGSVNPTTVTIPTTNTTAGSTYSSSPANESEAIATDYGNSGWISIGNLKNGGHDTIQLYGSSGKTNHIGYALSLTGWSGINVPSDATITSVTATINYAQTGGTSAVYLVGVDLLGVSPTPTPQSFGPSSNGPFTATFTGLSLTPAQANSGNLGCDFYFTCTQAPGTGAIISLTGVTLTVNYTTPNYNSITVSLARPLSPYQIGTSGGTGNTISAVATMTNATVISTVPNYGSGATAGWLTGWTLTVHFASGSGTLTCPLTMNVTGRITYLSGTAIVTNDVTYLNTVVATITANRSGPVGPPLALTTGSLPAGYMGQTYQQYIYATGGTAPYSWGVSGLPPGIFASYSNSLTMFLSGIITSPGDYFVYVTITDSSSPRQSAWNTYELRVMF
jgi:hypothetical protein